MPRRSTNSAWYTGGMLYRQGRLTGYGSPEIIATPRTDQKIRACQAFAWNPSITGAKAEEAFALTGSGPEMTTRLTGGGG
jgi:Xaa-Pro dipeptidase